MHTMNEKIARNLASKSDHQHYKHSVLIVRGGKIIARGFNKGAKHAEINAIGTLAAKDHNYFRGADLYSFRFNRTGPANSRPCIMCEKVIRELGMRRMFYFWKDRFPGANFSRIIFLSENL